MRLISFDDFIRLIPPNQLVIALTTRIQQLQTHMVQHKKDKHCAMLSMSFEVGRATIGLRVQHGRDINEAKAV